MPVNAILFDLDGTLVDSMSGIEYSSRAALHNVLQNREFSNLRKCIGPPIRAMFKKKFSDLDDWTLNELERAFRTSYDSEGWQKSVLFTGVEHTLECLAERGVKLFLVTNKPRLSTQRILNRLQLSKFFSEIVTPDSRPRSFTSKSEMVFYLMTSCSLDVQQALLVGDSDDDYRAAAACGLRFLAVSYGYGSTYKRLPLENVLTSFEQLIDRFSIFDR